MSKIRFLHFNHELNYPTGCRDKILSEFPSFLGGELPVAPSAIAPVGELHTPVGKVSMENPRALETHEIPEIIEQFRKGAEEVVEAVASV